MFIEQQNLEQILSQTNCISMGSLNEGRHIIRRRGRDGQIKPRRECERVNIHELYFFVKYPYKIIYFMQKILITSKNIYMV